jgi:hypothetical protein
MVTSMPMKPRTSGWLMTVALAATANAGEAAAAPPTSTVTGDVIAARGRWTADGRNILTDAIVRTADGDVDVIQLGGHAGGVTMAVIHGPAQLAPGMRVALVVHPTEATAAARAPRPRWLVDDVTVLPGGGAAPFVRTPTNTTKRPVYWAKSCVQVSRAQEGTTAVAGDAEQAVLTRSIATWTAATAACSYLDLVDLGTADSEVGNDGRNLIKFRDSEWCRPAVDGQEKHCFNHQASGITTLLFVDDPDSDRDGELIDADIELNGVDFAITIDGQGGGGGCAADLANTLVHELGHLLGLGHTCLGAAEEPRVDGDGNPVPLCSSPAGNQPAITDATMFPYQVCGETSKADLAADDIDALCTIYPKADDPGVCEGPDELSGGCCDHGGGGARGALALALAAAVALRRRRRAAPVPGRSR